MGFVLVSASQKSIGGELFFLGGDLVSARLMYQQVEGLRMVNEWQVRVGLLPSLLAGPLYYSDIEVGLVT